MKPRSKGGFWGEFWPKLLIIGALFVALWLLERYGIIRRW